MQLTARTPGNAKDYTPGAGEVVQPTEVSIDSSGTTRNADTQGFP